MPGLQKTGDLVFYVSKTDAWSENGQLLKLGRISLALYPKPYNSKTFSQSLELRNGRVVVNYGDTRIDLWVDANHPTIQIDIDSKTPLKATLTYETWRRARYQVRGKETNALYGVSEVGKDGNFIDNIYREQIPYFQRIKIKLSVVTKTVIPNGKII
jgi:hypothetical protein